MAQAGWFKNTTLLYSASDYFFLTDLPDEELEEELRPEERLTLADEELLLLEEETLADDPELRRDDEADLAEEREGTEGGLLDDLRLIVGLDPEYLELPVLAELEPASLLDKEGRDGKELEDRLLAEELFVLELDGLLKVEGSEG